MSTGRFAPAQNSMEGRQFAYTMSEALAYADTDKTKVAILKATISDGADLQFDFSMNIDPHIFEHGVVTVQPGMQSEIFHENLLNIEHSF
jgi:hypothetical protein